MKRAILVVCLCSVITGSGCRTISAVFATKKASESAVASLPSGTSLKSTGGVAEGAKISEFVSSGSLPVAAGSVVESVSLASGDKPAVATKVTLSRPSVFTFETKGSAAETPKNFTLPPPPSPVQIAAGEAAKTSLRWFVIVGALLAIAAGIAFYAGHMLAGLKLAIGAVAVPVLAYEVAEHVAMIAGALAVGAAVAAVALWYSHVKPSKELVERAESKAMDMEHRAIELANNLSDKLKGGLN